MGRAAGLGRQGFNLALSWMWVHAWERSGRRPLPRSSSAGGREDASEVVLGVRRLVDFGGREGRAHLAVGGAGLGERSAGVWT